MPYHPPQSPSMNKLMKENESLKKQVKDGKQKLLEVSAKYDNLVSEVTELKETISVSSNDSNSTLTEQPLNASHQETLNKILKIAESTSAEVKSFKENWDKLENSVQLIKSKLGEFAQYTRINSLLFQGLHNIPKHL